MSEQPNETVSLVFKNQDATPKTTAMYVSKDAVKAVMAWYGAYHAGDTYHVVVNNTKVDKDENGELVGSLP